MVDSPLLMLSGCVGVPTNYPIRTQVDRQRGFSMQGTMRSSDDPTNTRARIEKAFVAACRGPAEITQLQMKPRSSSIGLKFFEYDGVARCLTEPSPARKGNMGFFNDVRELKTLIKKNVDAGHGNRSLIKAVEDQQALQVARADQADRAIAQAPPRPHLPDLVCVWGDFYGGRRR